MQCFSQSLNNTGNADLVHHFGQLATAVLTQKLTVARIDIHNRLCFIKSTLLTTDHDSQLAVFCPRLSARYRRIEERDLLFCTCDCQFSGKLRRRCGVINKQGASFSRFQRTLLTSNDCAHIVIVADANKNNIGACCRFGWRCSRLAAIGLLPGLRFRCRAIIHTHRMPGLLKVSGHWIAHYAQSNKTHLHVLRSCLCKTEHSLARYCAGSLPLALIYWYCR